MSILDSRTVVTRKAHRCWGCGRRFQAGSSLRRVRSVEDGQFLTVYWCPVCSEVLAQPSYHYDDEFGFGELREEDPEWEAIRERMEGETP